VEPEHRLVQVDGCRRGELGFVEVVEVLDRLADIARVVVVVGVFVSGDDVSWFESFERPQRGDPLAASFARRLGQVHVRVVVDDITTDDQADGGNPKRGGASRVGVPGLHDRQLVPLEAELVAGNELG
jgi:hypothetical protein